MKSLNRLVFWVSVACGVLAAIEQLSKPPEERTWQGVVLGVVPYDFRKPTLQRLKDSWWNPHDERLFTPRAFGIGWDINLYQLQHRLMEPARTNGDG